MIDPCRTLCIVSDNYRLVNKKLEVLSEKQVFNQYSHLYCYTPDPHLINFNKFKISLPEVHISKSCTEESLDSILLWSKACSVSLIILSENRRFLKEIYDRYGYRRHNINFIMTKD